MSKYLILLALLFGCFKSGAPGAYPRRQKTVSTGPTVRNCASNPSLAVPVSGFPTSNKGCFPNIIPKPVPSDFRNKVGLFYEYGSKSLNEQVYNAFFINTLVGDGLVYLPGTTVLAVHAAEPYQHTTLAKNGQRLCEYQDIDILARLDGVEFVQVFDAAFGQPNPFYGVTYYLYDDPRPNGFEVVYSCNKQNTVSGMCEDPNVYVNTRVHPNKLSVADSNAINAIIDRSLKPYCMSAADLQRTIFRSDLAPCTDPPRQDFLNLVAGYDASLAHPASR